MNYKKLPSTSTEDKYPELMAHAVLAPVVANPLSMDTVENQHVQKARVYRLAKLAKGDFEEIATDFEAMIYLMTQSMAAPFTDRWYRIYFYLFRKEFPKAEGVLHENDGRSLDNMEETSLRNLKLWIYRKQKEAMKEKRAKGQVRPPSRSSTQPTYVETQTAHSPSGKLIY